jgi:SAM-dependent methyltransferase
MNQDALTQRYKGEGAASYNTVRSTSERWRQEHATVRDMLSAYAGATVLDIPVGTGRFVPIYKELGCRLVGVDISPDMLAETRRAAEAEGYAPDALELADATGLPGHFQADVAVSVRFFNWLDEPRARLAFTNIAKAARRAMIFSLTSVDLDKLPEGEREHRAAAIARSHTLPWQGNLPPNGAHIWGSFKQWIDASGFRLVRSTLILTGKNNLVNHIHLIER